MKEELVFFVIIQIPFLKMFQLAKLITLRIQSIQLNLYRNKLAK